MIIATTSAASLSAGQALGNLQGAERDNALFLMVIVIGVAQALFGSAAARATDPFRLVSVMTGFIIGIAVLTILSQLPTVTGYEPTAGNNKVTQTFNLLLNLDKINLATIAVSLVTLALALALPRTRLGNYGRLAAIIVPSLLALLFHLNSVRVVRDVGEIPGGIPTPHIPSFSAISFDVITGALAVALIILVQGAGVSQSVPNPDGSRRSSITRFHCSGCGERRFGLVPRTAGRRLVKHDGIDRYIRGRFALGGNLCRIVDGAACDSLSGIGVVRRNAGPRNAC